MWTLFGWFSVNQKMIMGKTFVLASSNYYLFLSFLKVLHFLKLAMEKKATTRTCSL